MTEREPTMPDPTCEGMGSADAFRGHGFFPPEAVMATVPSLYATEAVPLDDKLVHLHYFVGGCDWYVMEVDRERRLAFGWVDLGDPQNAELGYFDLEELRRLMVTPHGYPLVVERDLHWTPRPFGDIPTR